MSKRIAIVKMPWSTLASPSVGMGTLKGLLNSAGIPTDNLYLDFRFAKAIGYENYEKMNMSMFMLGEWFFSQYLFDDYAGETVDTIYQRIEMLYKCQKVAVPQDISPAWVERIRTAVPGFLEDCLHHTQWQNYAVVAFASVYSRHTASLLLARKLKERFPEIKIVFGGANVWGEIGREMLRAFDWVDYVIEGEGEQSLLNLVSNILNNNPYAAVDGVSFRQGPQLHFSKKTACPVLLDSLPIPDYTDYFEALDEAGLTGRIPVTIEFESSRGCWWGEKVQCAFCGVNGSSLVFRSKSPQRVIEELIQLDEQWGDYAKRHLAASDSVVNMDFFTTVFPQLIADGRNWNLFYEVKPNLSKEQLTLLKQVGMHHLLAGIESLDTQIMQVMHKGSTSIQNIQFLKWCQELEIDLEWNFLYGAPGETSSAYFRMAELIPMVTHLPPPGIVAKVELQRYSAYFREPEKYHIRDIRPTGLNCRIYPPEQVNLAEIAWVFDYEGGLFEGTCETYTRPVCESVHSWQRVYHEGTSMYYQINETDGIIALFDSRPAALTSGMVLQGIEADIYDYCDAIRSFATVCSYVREKGYQLSEREIKAILDKFVDFKLMYRENGQYLSLAVRGR